MLRFPKLRNCSRAFVHQLASVQRCITTNFGSTSSTTSKKLEGQVAIITGGARGIGAETTQLFVENGARVVIMDLDDDVGKALVEDMGPSTSFYRGNVSKEKDVAGAVDFAIDKYGKLDIMYNNAAYGGNGDLVHQMDIDVFDKCYEVNIRGVALGIKHAARVMIPTQKGCILTTCSVAGLMGGVGPTMYSYTKGAIVNVTRHAATELGVHGIRVNCISPAGCHTTSLLSYLKSFPGHKESTMDDLMKLMAQTSSLKGQYLSPQMVAKTALFLASEDGSYYSGQNMVLDGGFSSSKSFTLIPDFNPSNAQAFSH